MPTPQSLHSSSINPANLVELQVLTQVVTQLQSLQDISGSIPYLAKIVQILNNQKLNDARQLTQLRLVQADALFQLSEAYFHTQQFIQCEFNLLQTVKIWEKLVQQDQLKQAYIMLKTCYESMGKTQLAHHIDIKLSRISSDDS